MANRYENLFFNKRRPKRNVPIDWVPPADYEQELEWEGFISIKHWKESEQDDIEDYPLLKQDIADLEQHLMPVFWEFNQKAKHYQNRYYRYQWVFMWGAFLTTMLGALTTFAYSQDELASNIGGVDFVTTVLGIMTALVSALTAYYNYRSNQGSPQARWAKSRRLAEELRMNYYRYLGHLEPYNSKDRVQQLRRQVLEIRRKELQDA